MLAFGKSDKGNVRPTNQDAFAVDLQPQAGLIAVCDGMGGANAGNVASRFAIEAFMGVLRQATPADFGVEMRGLVLREAVDKANETVFSLATAQPEFRGMGTTLVGGIVTETGIALVNVGDSRAYRINGECAKRLTEDHSYVEEMLRRGKLTEEAARSHPNKNLITRAIGVEPEVECDLYEVELAKGDILLLCSDGLSGMLSDDQIVRILRDADSLEHGATQLIAAANLAGGVDNITVVLLTLEPTEGGLYG